MDKQPLPKSINWFDTNKYRLQLNLLKKRKATSDLHGILLACNPNYWHFNIVGAAATTVLSFPNLTFFPYWSSMPKINQISLLKLIVILWLYVPQRLKKQRKPFLNLLIKPLKLLMST